MLVTTSSLVETVLSFVIEYNVMAIPAAGKQSATSVQLGLS